MFVGGVLQMPVAMATGGLGSCEARLPTIDPPSSKSVSMTTARVIPHHPFVLIGAPNWNPCAALRTGWTDRLWEGDVGGWGGGGGGVILEISQRSFLEGFVIISFGMVILRKNNGFRQNLIEIGVEMFLMASRNLSWCYIQIWNF